MNDKKKLAAVVALVAAMMFLAGGATLTLSGIGGGWIVPSVIGTAPFPCDSLHVLIVYEKDELKDWPLSKSAILTSVPLREWLDSKGGKLKTLDQDTKVDRDEKVWQLARAVDGPLPRIVASNGGDGFVKPLPDSDDDVIKLLDPLAR